MAGRTHRDAAADGGGSGELSVAVSVEASVKSPLMTPTARRLFALLGMLPDGVTRDDLTELLPNDGLAAAAVLSQLGLAFVEGDRLRMLGAIREQAAAAHLPQPSDLARAVTHYCQLAAILGNQVGPGGATEALTRLQAETGNITAMVERAAADHLTDALAGAVTGLANYWRVAGLAQPAVLGVAEQAIEKYGSPAQRALIENALAGLAFNQSDYESARARYEQALPLYQRAGDVLGAADSIKRLGDIALVRSDHDTARHQYERSLSLYQEAGDVIGGADTIRRLGDIARDRGQLDEAEDWYHKALTIFDELGDHRRAASTYHQLGNTAYLRGRLGEADDWYRKALTSEEELGDRPGMATVYFQLGTIAQDRGWLDEAEDWYHKALTIFDELGDHRRAVLTYHRLGIIAQAGERRDEADDWHRKALTMTDPAAAAARSAAVILAPDLDPNLSAEVEAALAARDTQQRPDRYLDPASLANLIVSIATLAWTIYNDQRKHTPELPPASIARQVRITLREQDTPLPVGTERITEIVATEITRQASPPQ